MASVERESVSRHAIPLDDLFDDLSATRTGLPTRDVHERIKRFGPNRLPAPRPLSAVTILLRQFRSVVVGLLLVAAVISFVFSDLVDAAAIAAVLAINTTIGFVIEWRARRAMAALLELEVPHAVVVRDGQVQSVEAHTLVPGDVIVMDAGQQVPADGRLFEETDFRTDEAALTGESLPVSKSVTVLPAPTVLAERLNMVYKGTVVVSGTGRAVITATGSSTELGRIGVLAEAVEAEPTPLERRLDELGRRLVWLALAVAALVGALSAWQGVPLVVVAETAIALAVAAVPEALPAVATIALAVGMRRMARRRALVRRLPAVEALGSTTVVCTDKTRTLTSGDMTIVRVWTGSTDIVVASEAGLQPDDRLRTLLEAAVLASRPPLRPSASRGGSPGDPVDVAFLRAGERVGIDPVQLVRARPPESLIPFSSERKLMAVFSRVDGVLNAYVKGAPRQIMACSARSPDGRPFDESSRRALSDANERLASAGYRVLAVAAGPVRAADPSALCNLTVLGLVGMMDPPAPGVRETIALLRGAGMRTVMLTGDQRLTAETVGRDLGVLEAGRAGVVDGRDLESMPSEVLESRVGEVGVFSRISPEHKLAIVGALQRRGEIVAMLGDGVNDAAALRKADVGVAMGRRGTDVAKEAADIVLEDDRFETVAVAVEEGRVIFDNIRKFVFYLFSCNVAEVLVLLTAGLFGAPLPLTPLQLLWLNIVTDTFPALALAAEPGEPGIMARPPRDPREALLSRSFLGSVFAYATLITAVVLAAFLWALQRDPARAVTMTFMTLALAQIFHLGNARSSQAVLALRRLGANRFALGAVALAIALQLVAMYEPRLSRILEVRPLGKSEWILVVALSAAPAVLGQILKIRRRS